MVVEAPTRDTRMAEDARLLGDLAGHAPHIRTRDIINPYLGNNGIPENEAIADEVAMLEIDLVRFQLHVANEKNYPDGAKEAIKSKLEKGDGMAWSTPLERAAARMAQFREEVTYVTDFDNTLSDAKKPIPSHPEHNPQKGDYLKHLVPLSEFAEDALSADRSNFTDVFVTYWQRFLRDPHAVAVARSNGQHIPMRNGVNTLFAGLTDIDAQKVVLSANFEPFVEGGLDQLDPEVLNNTELWAITENSIVATDKGTVIEHIAKSHPEAFTIFAGDGSSDKPAMDAKEVGLFFALEGSSFAKELEEKGFVYLPYETGEDIINQLHEVRALAAQLRQAK